MRVSELIAYLKKYADDGKGDADVVVAYKTWNPISEAEDIRSALFIETSDGECRIVFQTE
jgi:hypothetical protein